jgi:hypothetical protein
VTTKLLLLLPLLLLTPIILAMDPPGITWAIQYGSAFYNVHETTEGCFIVAGRKWFSDYVRGVFLYGPDGSLIWQAGDTITADLNARWVEQVPSGGFIATGECWVDSTASVGLFLMRLSENGGNLWTKVYDYEDATEMGYCVLPYLDGGFLICGRRGVAGMGTQAWLLRTDAEGDTLWTREWGWTSVDRAMRVLYVAGGLTVLMHGSTQYTSVGPHLARYDMEGNLLWDTPIIELAGYGGQDLCIGTNGGYTLLSQYATYIAHTDDQGNVLWMELALGSGWMYGWAISPTMDGGYIYGGENRPMPPSSGSEVAGEVTDSDYSGMVVRYDQDGNELWWDYVYNEECSLIYSIRQLSQGGYIAAGLTLNGTGLLLRYEPETGISDGEGLPAVMSLGNPHPNPSSEGFSIFYSLPSSMQVDLAVYDLSGRRVETLLSGPMEAGSHQVLWDPGDAPSGCYLVVLRTEEGIETRRCVLMR